MIDKKKEDADSRGKESAGKDSSKTRSGNESLKTPTNEKSVSKAPKKRTGENH